MAGSSVLGELSAHLQDINQNPSTSLDTQLLERAELYTSTPEYQNELWKETRPLFLQLAGILAKLQQDPSPLVHLSLKLVQPYSFDHVRDVEFEQGLNLAAKPFHLLLLTLLEKATARGSYADALANRPAVVQAIVRLWLCTDDTGIATKAGELLVDLLRVSKNEPGDPTGLSTYGAGPMWKRLFEDKDVYYLFYLFTSLKNLPPGDETPLNKKDITIAQARLLEWLPKVGNINWDTIVLNHQPDVESLVGLQKDQSLAHYASLRMVDTVDDLLMHMSLINFFSDLISTVTRAPHNSHYISSVSLDFLKEVGVHKQLIDFHTTDTPGIEHSFLSTRTANYISVYASTYPLDFESSPERETIWNHVARNVRKCEPDDLHILASLPRRTLMPVRSTGLAWDESVVLTIPIKRTTADALKTLATVFHGPLREEVTFPPSKPGSTMGSDATVGAEQAYSRLLLSLYYTRSPSMFFDIITHADTIAMKDNALAALVLLRSLITANWPDQPLTSYIENPDPIVRRLDDFPKSGIELVLNTRISGGLLPYLMKPATMFSNLVGGRGDAENAAYQVAMAKFDVLKALGERLERAGGPQDILAMVRGRINEGPWGVGGSAGSRIGTLEL